MADEDLIITVDSLDEPFDTTVAEPVQRQEGPVRIKVPGRDQNGKKVATPKPAETDDAIEDLRGQLTAQQQRTADAERRANAAAEAARTSAAQVDEARNTIVDTRAQAIDTEIASATTESASLRGALKAAMDAGDFDKAAELQEKIGDVRARLYDAKKEKTAIEQGGVSRTEGAVREQPRQQQQRVPQTAEERRQAILAPCTPETRAWLENHSDILDDPVRGAEASYVHARALKAGLQPDSPEYFRFAEEQMGYTKVTRTNRQQQDDDGGSRQNGARRVVEAAPVDRGGSGGDGGGGGSPMRVELTRGELENATNGTIVWNKGPGVPANMVGKPIGAKEMARRKALMTQEGRYSAPAVS